MSAPLVVNTADGTVWTRRGSLSDGRALFAPAEICVCPQYVMATEAELAEIGIVGSADALPMPVAMPPWPPEPRTELERLGRQVVQLGDRAVRAEADAKRARAERDAMRERVSEPYGCAHCGEAKRYHGRRYLTGVGMHGWERPSDEQVKARMVARRAARGPSAGLLAEVLRLRAVRHSMDQVLLGAFGQRRQDQYRIAELSAEVERLRVQRDAYCDRVDTLTSVARSNQRHVVAVSEECQRLAARVVELERERHSTNEALSDAAEALRADRDRIAELEAERTSYPPALPWAELMDNDDLTGFLDELAAAAIVNADALTVLATVEAACIRWRVIAEAQHGHNTAPGPDAEPDGITRLTAPTQALQTEGGAETGGAS